MPSESSGHCAVCNEYCEDLNDNPSYNKCCICDDDVACLCETCEDREDRKNPPKLRDGFYE